MAKKTKKLVFTKNVPQEVKDGVEISIGMGFKRIFKQADEPFMIERKYANAILRAHDFFTEFEEVPADTPKPEERKTVAEHKPANDKKNS